MRLLTTTIHLVTNPAGPDTTNSPSGTRPRPARNPTNWTPMRRHSRTTAHSVRVPTGGTTSLRRRLGPPVAPPSVLLHRKPADPEDARTWGVGRRAHDLDDGIAKSTVYGALSAPILLAPITSAVMWTPVRRHCRTTAHSVKVSARQGVPGTEGSSGAAGFDGTEGPGGIPEGQRVSTGRRDPEGQGVPAGRRAPEGPRVSTRQRVSTRTTRFAGHGGSLTGGRPDSQRTAARAQDDDPLPTPRVIHRSCGYVGGQPPVLVQTRRRACAHRCGARNHRSVIPAIGVCWRRRSRRTEAASAMVCGGRRDKKAHATTRQAGTVPQGFALPPSARVTPDGVAAVWASRNRHHCSSASGGPSARGAPHAPRDAARAALPPSTASTSAPGPRTPQHRQTQWAPPIRRGPLRCSCSALYLFCVLPTTRLFPLRATATCLDSRHCLMPPPLRAAPHQPSRNTTPMPPRG
ncbi:Hypothetical protein PFR_JS9-2_2131 [Propionibacterium freudenreichii]|nr:Hypothetical protein PFR_JS9-1_2135 [Propionibacterium freudenreichii]SCQ70878.1 Hypothetical protein PFR_JS9-2_2131 [Propionibacterium freudenreichii]